MMNAIVIEQEDGAWDLCLKLAENGMLAKPTQGNVIRFTPPLVMTENQLSEGIEIIKRTVRSY